ncbi:hypothetical protein N8D56_03105 [Devosia sp. A8/3-2]|nr:hypothetical protein N8D56_03105 [Devosia sp. A8/3-2]
MAAKMLSGLAAILGLGLMLTGCIDAKVDIALTSPTTAQASLTQSWRPISMPCSR